MGATKPGLISMADSRDLSGRDVRHSWRLAAAVINLAYAKRHGYDFEARGSHRATGSRISSCCCHVTCHRCDPQVLRLPSATNATADGASSAEDSTGCWHPVFGSRHPSWCKMLAVARALMHDRHGARPFVMVMDSDFVYFNHSMRIEEYVLRSGVQPFVINNPLQAASAASRRCPRAQDFFASTRAFWPLAMYLRTHSRAHSRTDLLRPTPWLAARPPAIADRRVLARRREARAPRTHVPTCPLAD